MWRFAQNFHLKERLFTASKELVIKANFFTFISSDQCMQMQKKMDRRFHQKMIRV